MGLDDVVKDRAMQVGDVKSSLDPEDVEMKEGFWEVVAVYYPHLLEIDAMNMDEKQIRYLVMILDRAINEEVDEHVTSESNKREAERTREELLNYI